jgi:hypothetical protein
MILLMRKGAAEKTDDIDKQDKVERPIRKRQIFSLGLFDFYPS